ncbi:MAG: 7,8-didemethyl-8-hydroxy-5-deazariboflavin synthase subunit CofG [Candidatus Tectomicrobia bacterium RIFCSPLOWO2_02_FULL_70_19]|nr:MAG: 7,8-didemethyl-8-hydroxy-5-deazariboflavin synthase subunit CofG [Candidatus Tectomicrobia bacterium RIFCSPLOWO2_02_FULL_70_19]
MRTPGSPALRAITYSFNFTLPVTTWCLNRCGYCSFRSDAPVLMAPEECARRARAAAAQGVIEALVMTGEGIDRHAGLRKQLAGWGFGSYAAYCAEVCRMCLAEGMLPHTNIGTLEAWELELLKPWNVSMGMMVETVSPEAARGAAHRNAPTKAPELRLATVEEAGKLGIAFTTGILIGIGERPEERVETLEAIAEVHKRHGHVQEIILQPLNPQPGTLMARWARPPDEDVAALIPHVQRLMPGVHIQIPPNLVDDLPALLRAGGDDLGGIAPEADHINPNRPWPELEALDRRLRPEGMGLRLRMPIYDEFIAAGWCPEPTRPVVEKLLERRDQAEGLLAPAAAGGIA